MTRYSMVLLRIEGKPKYPDRGRIRKTNPLVGPFSYGGSEGNGSSPSEADYKVGMKVVYPCVSQMYLLAQLLEGDP